ncbi:MAG: hypothetical protein QOH25_2306 [Acidobacteriota bacterium]|nr:hypothetical protein [Acidobacteriota bacterium]
MLTLHKIIEGWFGFGIYQVGCATAITRFDASSEEATEPDDGDAPLDDAARSEREYVRQRLREELKREPTEVELDEWLRQHTEGY